MSEGCQQKRLSVIVPVYNEEAVLSEFHKRITRVGDSLPMPIEILYMNDGSADHTVRILEQLRESDERVAVIDLSRHYGKEIALTAGLDYATGDAVIIIDADLQDPPELIPGMITHWEQGFDVVYAKRTSRHGESLMKRATAYLFYRLIRKVSYIVLPEDTGDFRLLSRRAVEALKQFREQHRFMKGLFAWIGYSQIGIPYVRGPRSAGKTKWDYWKLWNFAIEGFTSFTTVPLKISTYFGFLTAIGAFVYAARIIYKKLVYGDPVPGYPSLMVVILFLGGIQLMVLGLMGEYIGRMFDETKRRPLYFIKRYTPPKNSVIVSATT